jgi:hypothetical protein
VSQCVTCGAMTTRHSPDGECFRCHVHGIGFTYRGGAIVGHGGWHTTEREYLAEHVGDTRSPDVEKVS